MTDWHRANARRAAGFAVLSMAAVGMVACGQKRQPQPVPPTATAPPVYNPPSYPVPAPRPSTGGIPITPVPEGGISAEDKEFILSHRPIYSEEGSATWYTAPYKGRKAANGQVFSDEALTAAHRTLAHGIADRGHEPQDAANLGHAHQRSRAIRPDTIIDLTKASAQSIGICRPGSGRVRVDVYETPKPMDVGGRWCVQIGPFLSERKAIRFKEKLLSDYPGSKVIEFAGERSYWVRIRPQGDDREQAEEMARRLQPDEGVAYLTRLD